MAYALKPPHSKTYRIYFYDAISGKKRSISAKTTDKAAANKAAKQFEAKQRLGLAKIRAISVHRSQSKPFAFLEFFITSKNIAATTATTYRNILKIWVNVCGEKNIEHYTSMDYYKFLEHLRSKKRTVWRRVGEDLVRQSTEKPLSQNTIANYTRHLHSYFAFAQKFELIQHNIINREKTKKSQVRVIPKEHLEMIFNRLQNNGSGMYYLPIKLKYLAAMRASELVNFHGSDVHFDLDYLYIRNTKGTKTNIPLIVDLKEFLQSFKLLPKKQWPDMTYNSLKMAFQRACNSAGLKHYKYSLHMLRKTRGTQLAMLGVPPVILQEFMRHEDFATTRIFYTFVETIASKKIIDNLLKPEP